MRLGFLTKSWEEIQNTYTPIIFPCTTSHPQWMRKFTVEILQWLLDTWERRNEKYHDTINGVSRERSEMMQETRTIIKTPPSTTIHDKHLLQMYTPSQI